MNSFRSNAAISRVMIAVLLIIFSRPVDGGEILTYKELALPASVPVRSVDYEVVPQVKDASLPGFLTFSVRCPHGVYEIEGVAPLKKLLYEIAVIESVRRNEEGSSFFEGFTDSLSQTGQGLVNFIIHPIQSTIGIGQAAAELTDKVEGAFHEKEAGESTSFSEKILGGSERDIAAEFGVDVYTRNPRLRELLRQMAAARVGGRSIASVGKFLLPMGAIVSVTLTASGINASADRVINDKDPGELYRLNETALSKMGFVPHQIRRLLNLPFFTPREVTYLRFYLDRLQPVPGFDDILYQSVETGSYLQALKLLYQAEMAAERFDPENPFERLELYPEGLAVYQDVRLIFIVPYDFLDLDVFGKRILDRTAGLMEKNKIISAEILNGGRITLNFMSAAMAKKITSKSWILLHPQKEV